MRSKIFSGLAAISPAGPDDARNLIVTCHALIEAPIAALPGIRSRHFGPCSGPLAELCKLLTHQWAARLRRRGPQTPAIAVPQVESRRIKGPDRRRRFIPGDVDASICGIGHLDRSAAGPPLTG